MLEFLYRILIGHNHKWKIIATNNRRGKHDDRISGICYTLQCEVCGKMKQQDVF